MLTLVSSLPSPCLSFPACEGLGLLPTLRSLHIPLSLPWAALSLSPKLPPRISGLTDPESHLGSASTESPHGFLHGWLGTAAHSPPHVGLSPLCVDGFLLFCSFHAAQPTPYLAEGPPSARQRGRVSLSQRAGAISGPRLLSESFWSRTSPSALGLWVPAPGSPP